MIRLCNELDYLYQKHPSIATKPVTFDMCATIHAGCRIEEIGSNPITNFLLPNLEVVYRKLIRMNLSIIKSGLAEGFYTSDCPVTVYGSHALEQFVMPITPTICIRYTWGKKSSGVITEDHTRHLNNSICNMAERWVIRVRAWPKVREVLNGA